MATDVAEEVAAVCEVSIILRLSMSGSKDLLCGIMMVVVERMVLVVLQQAMQLSLSSSRLMIGGEAATLCFLCDCEIMLLSWMHIV